MSQMAYIVKPVTFGVRDVAFVPGEIVPLERRANGEAWAHVPALGFRIRLVPDEFVVLS